MRTLTLARGWVGCLLWSTWLHAQDQTVTATARELAKESLRAYDEGRYDEAAEKAHRVYQVVRLPTIALNRARALVKLGRFVEASETYLEALRIERIPAWQAIQDEAQATAEHERMELLPRIPRLRFELENATVRQVSVVVDEEPVPNSLLQSEQLVDPGAHKIVATDGRESLEFTLAFREGEQRVVTLKFEPKAIVAPLVPVAPAIPVGSTASSSVRAPRVAPARSSPGTAVSSSTVSRQRRIVGWSSVGLGSATILFGAIEGFVASAKRERLLATGMCAPDGVHCDPTLAHDVNAYQTTKTLATVGFIAGGVLTMAGLTVLLWPTDSESSHRLAVLVGPRFLGVRGELR